MSDPTTRRHRMLNAFTESHGEEVAMALSENLAPHRAVTHPQMDAALHNLHVQIRADLAELKASTDARFAILDARIDALTTRTDERFATLDERFENLASTIDATIDAKLETKLHSQTVVLLSWTVGLWLALAAVLVAIAVVS